MNCQEFWEQGSEQSNHLVECPRCNSAWAAEQRLAAALRAASSELANERAPERVESRLLAALRAHVGLRLRPRRPLWVDLLTWTSAAAAVGVLAVFLVRDRPPDPAPHPRPHAADLAVSGPAAAVGADAGLTSEREFIALPNAAALESDEESNLVRVELSRSAMVAMGFDVDDEEAGDSISADVMLGPDGLARAVRFLD